MDPPEDFVMINCTFCRKSAYSTEWIKPWPLPALPEAVCGPSDRGLKMHHELKLQQCFFEPAEQGLKTFEIRRNSDRGFQAGDTVEFREVNHLGIYTHNELHAKITYVLNYAQKEDYVVFAFVLIEKP